MSGGIIYEYEDGGSYCGELEGETSHGLGVCTGPKGEGTFEGRWDHGNQLSGVYRWPNGVEYSGEWADNTRHGMGVETRRDGTEYSGEFTRGRRGTFGVAKLPNGVYKGQWVHGAQDGEGVETYKDHGCYRGQYKKGLRSGFGTRTSAAYEAKGENNPLPTSTSDPSLSLKSKAFSDQRMNSLKRSHLLHKQKDSVSSLCSKDEVAQIYEGEWVDDKRHGHGVLKVLGKYTYYGQWSSNTRTGHGVLVDKNGAKEEGEWHNGTRVAIVKRHKVILFKSHQLEQKVKEAHTKSLQAAEKARSKAELAISRASSAVKRSEPAAMMAEKARRDAMGAVAKAELYKNAPTVSESAKTPVVGSCDIDFPSIDPARSVAGPLPSGYSLDSHHRLGVSQPIVPSTSFGDLRGTAYSDSGRGLGSDSPVRHRQSNDSVSSSDDSVSRGLYEKGLSRNSSSESYGSSRRISHAVTTGHQKVKIQRSLSDHEEEYSGSDYRRREFLRQRRRDHRTGEVDQEDVSDHEGESPDRTSPVKPAGYKLAGNKEEVTIDMLNQMAKWNRMVAFLNFGLLLVLLLLILGVFASMYYYQLVSYYRDRPDPEEPSRPGGFLTPLA